MLEFGDRGCAGKVDAFVFAPLNQTRFAALRHSSSPSS